MRMAGVLMPVFSLPSKYGIGCFSKEAYDFVDHLKAAGQSMWQILPLGPTSYGDSPYSSFSTFAGNPYYIDLERLIHKGWITEDEADSIDFGSDPLQIDYEKVYENRYKLLRIAFQRSAISRKKQFLEFRRKNAFWLEEYALYMAIKDEKKSVSWTEWEEELKLRKSGPLKEAKKRLKEDIEFYEFLQYEFEVEWLALKSYANQNGIRIVGDIPIYVALDSADAWSNPKLFQFDSLMQPKGVAGCPPDAFTEDGQLWGNPLYDWPYHKETGYDWWLKRLERCFQLYDIVRIDHFRGFDSYYAIPYGEETAVNGKWEKGPGYALFDAIKKAMGKRPIIAEDLGFLTPSVLRLVKRTGFPGMKILEFAFDAKGDSVYLPHHHIQNSVVYTGTHDNDTLLGWYQQMSKRDRKFATKYLGLKGVPLKEVPWEFIRSAYMSVADYCIIPMQDYLGLGSEGRINTPSTLGGNWVWRMNAKAFTKKLEKRIMKYVKTYKRTGISGK